MLLVRRPRAPKGFNRQAREARSKIRSMIRGMPAGGARPTSDDFDDRWSDFKHHLAQAQHGRCGYCDGPVLASGDGTVDHYRPKAEVRALHDDPATWGKQKPSSASVRDRETQPVSEIGYHWLAYAWSNYVFACSVCNEKWKRAIFPVGIHPRCCPPRPKGREEPLLMHCYGSTRPGQHLQFNPDGSVEARGGSRHGRETIRTVGLDRDPLRQERRHVAEDVFECLRRWADGDEAQQAEALRDLLRLGKEDRPFAGVARAIVEQRVDMSWEELVALAA
jgi:hypothetical protein